MNGVIRVNSSQIGGPPRVLSKRERYLQKYKARDKPKILERQILKAGIKELEPLPEKPRRHPPQYISFSSAEKEHMRNSCSEEIKERENKDFPTCTSIVVGDPFAVFTQHSCRTPTLPKSRASTSHGPKQHSRCRTSDENFRNYDQAKSITWKYFGEVDSQMGCLTEHIRVRKPAKIYAKTLQFSTKGGLSLTTRSPLTSTPRG